MATTCVRVAICFRRRIRRGVAFTRSYVGYVHAIAHSLGRYGIPHGLANAIILPHMLRAYGTPPPPKLADLARMAGIAPATAQDSLAAEAFIDWVDRMNEALRNPQICLRGIRRPIFRKWRPMPMPRPIAIPRSTFDGPFGARAYVRGRRGWYV